MKKYLWVLGIAAITMVSCCNKNNKAQETCKTQDSCCESSCCGAQNLCADYTANSYSETDKAAITKAIDYYIEGGRNGDSQITRKGFAEGATMSWAENGKLQCVPIQTLYDIVDQGGPSEVSYDMTLCNVQNDVAMVRIESRFDKAKYTDMFTLVKDNDRWKIVNKIYHLKN